MTHPDDAAAMAFAVLRNRGYRFLAVSAEGVVVSNGSPTLAIDVSRPVGHPVARPVIVDSADPPERKRRRGYTKSGVKKLPHGYVKKVTNYQSIMNGMKTGDSHLFPPVAGTTLMNLAMVLANACGRYWGKGGYSIRTNPEGIKVTRK